MQTHYHDVIMAGRIHDIDFVGLSGNVFGVHPQVNNAALHFALDFVIDTHLDALYQRAYRRVKVGPTVQHACHLHPTALALVAAPASPERRLRLAEVHR